MEETTTAFVTALPVSRAGMFIKVTSSWNWSGTLPYQYA